MQLVSIATNVMRSNPAQCDKVCQWLATCRWFSQGTTVSSTNKTDRYDIYNWNIVESGVKHHNTNNNPSPKIFWGERRSLY